MYSTSKIAILMATYNGEKFIKEQIDSILAQTYTDFVLYIHDDGSTDGTMSILKEYEAKNPARIVIMEGESTGCARNNFLYMHKMVNAPYYMCSDQDDVWLKDKIEITIGRMEKLEKLSTLKPNLVYTELRVVDERLNTIEDTMSVYQRLDCKDNSESFKLMQNSVTGCTMMVNRQLRDMMCGFYDIDNIIMHDWWAAIIAAHFGAISFIDKPTILYRQHGDNSVGAKKSHGLKFILSKLNKSDEIKKSLELTRIQAYEFAKSYDLSVNSIPFLYAESKKYGKIKRTIFYKKYGFRKSSFLRNIGLFIWG